jgi:hypothetical protein
MHLSASGFSLEAPPGYFVEETTLAVRAAVRNGPSPSLIVNSKPVRAGATVEMLATEIVAELSQTLGEMKVPAMSEFTFEDGHKGIVISHGLTTQKGSLRQYFALRLSGQQLATITLTVPEPALNEGSAPIFMKCLASLKAVTS